MGVQRCLFTDSVAIVASLHGVSCGSDGGRVGVSCVRD